MIRLKEKQQQNRIELVKTIDGADRVREAIILQAVQDLKNAYMFLKQHEQEEEKTKKRMKRLIRQDNQKEYNKCYNLIRRIEQSRINMTECEKFFRGNWFARLCNIDGEAIIRHCKDMAAVEKKVIK